MNSSGAAGWHGKLPAVSDFASRRLDPRFIDLWDGWMAAGLARMRAEDPDGWVQAYLASPTWRFLVPPNFFPAPFNHGAWVGVVMPSVDRVGRYYPLTLAAPLDQTPRSIDAQAWLWRWLQEMEDTAWRALDEDWAIEALERQLHQIGLPLSQHEVAPSAAAGPVPLHAREFFTAVATGSCAWYTGMEGGPQILQSQHCDDAICRLWAR